MHVFVLLAALAAVLIAWFATFAPATPGVGFADRCRMVAAGFGSDLGALVIDNPKAEMEAHLKRVRDIAAAADDAGRDFTDEERAEVKSLLDQVEVARKAAERRKDDDELRTRIEALGSAEEFAAINEKALEGARRGLQTITQAKSIGQQVAEAKALSDFLKTHGVEPGGRLPDSVKGFTLPIMHLPGLKALLTGESSTSAGALVQNDWRGLLEHFYQRPLTLRDVLTVGTTTSDTVEYARMVSVTNAAAPVPEATTDEAITGEVTEADGGLKPKSAMTFERVTEPVKTIAHWLPATKRALSDAGQLRTLIDEFLRYGLEEELEDQVVTGNGQGENFTGLLGTQNVQAQPFDTDIFVTVRKAITKVQVVGRARTNAVLIHPADDERVDLERDNEDRFYGAGPFAMGPSVLWGRPRVVTEAVPEGTAIVGDFRHGVIWDREQATISASDSHSDFFTRNLVAILAESRAAFGVLRPQAFVVCDLAGS